MWTRWNTVLPWANSHNWAGIFVCPRHCVKNYCLWISSTSCINTIIIQVRLENSSTWYVPERTVHFLIEQLYHIVDSMYISQNSATHIFQIRYWTALYSGDRQQARSWATCIKLVLVNINLFWKNSAEASLLHYHCNSQNIRISHLRHVVCTSYHCHWDFTSIAHLKHASCSHEHPI